MLARKLAIGSIVALATISVATVTTIGGNLLEEIQTGYYKATETQLQGVFSEGYEMGMEDTLNSRAPLPVNTVTVTEYIEVPTIEVVTETVYRDIIKNVIEYVEVPGDTIYVTETVAENVDKDAIYDRGYERGASDAFSSFSTALLTPCATESSDNCYWNAQTQGNGQGTSFVSVNGSVWYLN